MRNIFYYIFLLSVAAYSQTVSISGTVSDESGTALEDVVVSLVNVELSDTTDVNGQYTISGEVKSLRDKTQHSPALSFLSISNGQGIFHTHTRQFTTITLYDMKGSSVEILYKDFAHKGANRFSLDEKNLSQGMYMLHVRNKSGEYSYPYLHIPGADQFISLNSSNSASTPLAKQNQVDWIQAQKTGYAVYSQQIDSYTGVYDITMTESTEPDFGPNVKIYDSSMDMGTIQTEVDAIADQQEPRDSEFGPNRYALLFKPGSYSLDVRVGYYTQAIGLGLTPGLVDLNGTVRSRQIGSSALSMFWRAAENFAITPSSGSNTWAASQAAPMRRLHIKGNLNLSEGGYTSGGFLANSWVEGTINAGTQQQYFNRNVDMGGWSHAIWNMFFLGVINPPAGTWPDNFYTTIDQTPVIRDKPFLFFDDNRYQVFVPALSTNTQGPSWKDGDEPGEALPIDQFYIAHEETDSAATINAALESGKDLLLTPGKYNLEAPILVTKPGTIVLGIGYASLIPTQGTEAMVISDVGGVMVAGVTFDAGPMNSPSLLTVGPAGSTADHSADPVVLSDLFCRVGTTVEGATSTCVTINSNNVIADHFWLWRADHGPSATEGRPGWNVNVAPSGLIVNGDDVTIYGLFNEHFQEYQTIWNGDGGRTYFYQCEMPYDPPDQASWTAPDGSDGYAAYKVADDVTTHQAWGLGIYNVFWEAPVWAENAIEVPDVTGVKMTHQRTRYLNGVGGGIRHVINGVGEAATDGNRDSWVIEYPAP